MKIIRGVLIATPVALAGEAWRQIGHGLPIANIGAHSGGKVMSSSRFRPGVLTRVFTAVAWISSALAQSPGTLTPTGNLTVPRIGHTATLLPSGKVLIAGGVILEDVESTKWASAELYDPSTGTFRPTGDTTTPRGGSSATLLPTGQVLIAGGGLHGAGSSAELYDPATGTFRATGSMTASRGGHTATLLNTGRVLIVGGWYPPNPTSAPTYQPAELYDPATGTFTATGDLMEAQVDTANLLPNGRVLITAAIGFGGGGHAYLYDPAMGIFTRTSDVVDLNMGPRPAATLLAGGKVLFAGGDNNELGGSAGAGIYDPGPSAFRSVEAMPVSMLWATATLLPEGKVLVAGGDDVTRCAKDPAHCLGPPGSPPGNILLYDPAAGQFAASAVFHSEGLHAATLLPDGTVLLSGGWACCGGAATAEIYHPSVLSPSPVLYSVGADHQGAILHGSTQQAVTPDSPAVAGEAIEIYGTGLIAGAVIPPQVAIGGHMAEVLYFGAAPGYAGLNQIDVRVPGGVASGPVVPVRLNYLSRPSNEVTIAVQ